MYAPNDVFLGKTISNALAITRDIEIVKDELVSNDIQKILYANLTRPELDVSVVRVVIPEMELYTIDPSRAGYRFLKVD